MRAGITISANATYVSGVYAGHSPLALVEKYGSPLYVYSEAVLRERCREIRNLIRYDNYRPSYSAKANSNIRLLEIIREEGIEADAMSPGEIMACLKAGFTPERIFFVGNNVSREEMRFAAEQGIMFSADSLPQLEMYGRVNPGGKVAVRINTGVGAGHHEMVITGGEKTKFGINVGYLSEIKTIIQKYGLKLAGLNTHIGSCFMEPEPYLNAARSLTEFAMNFEGLEFLDFGGGFGVPYALGEERLNLAELGEGLSQLINEFTSVYGRITVKTEPGRYIAAECGILLGTVNAVKFNGCDKYIGSDLGFNVFARPILYGSRHRISVYGPEGVRTDNPETVILAGNICESGDTLARDILMPASGEGDIIGIMDTGAYGYSMSSNYNLRPRPAEVLLRVNGETELIRRRQTYEDMIG